MKLIEQRMRKRADDAASRRAAQRFENADRGRVICHVGGDRRHLDQLKQMTGISVFSRLSSQLNLAVALVALITRKCDIGVKLIYLV